MQGNESMTHLDMITEAVTPMLDSTGIIVTNLLGDIESEEESIDMMRVLEHGKKVKMVSTSYHTYPVDTEADLKRVEERMYEKW